MQAAIHRSKQIKTRFSRVFTDEQAEVLADTISESYKELVKTSDFNEHKDNFNELKGDFNELKVDFNEFKGDFNEFKVDFNELKGIVKNLGVKMVELADAQKKTEIKVEELTEIQKQMQIELRELAKEHKETKRQVGGLSQAVGYGLEDKIMPFMTDFVKKNYGIEAALVKRKKLIYPDGKYDELDIYVEGTKEGKKAFVIGECKAQLAKKDAIKFDRLIKRAAKALKGEIFVFLAGYSSEPVVENYIRENYPQIGIFESYEFELNYNRN